MVLFVTRRRFCAIMKASISLSVILDINVCSPKYGRMNFLKFQLRASMRHLDRPASALSTRNMETTATRAFLGTCGLVFCSTRKLRSASLASDFVAQAYFL